MHHFPKDWLPILLLITLIAYAVSVEVEVIEDGTPEEEDLAKALALSKRFFWRTMMENWECRDKEVAIKNPKEIGAKNVVELKQICERWKVKALAADAFLKSWESHEGASSSSSSAIIPNNQIKVKKPQFRVKQDEIQLSSAMEAIKAAYRVLFGWRAAEGFNSYEFDFMNLSGYLHQKISPKEYWDSVQELGLDMQMTCKKVIEMKTKYEANLARMIVDDYLQDFKDFKELSESIYQLAVPKPKKMHLERFVGEVFFNYTHLIRNPILKKYPDELKELKPLLDPCEEAKLKVKKMGGRH
uniref:Uncharacterized protein n=1 Tax=Globodera rostochiensis TaxID=31243 RepID=A0A914H4E1_GLORO